MAAKQTRKVGETVEAKEVVTADGRPFLVTGGSYVLDTPGTHVIDGVEVEVK